MLTNPKARVRCIGYNEMVPFPAMQELSTALPNPEPRGTSDAPLRLIADSVPALMAYYDLPELRCRFANQGYAAYNGHSAESIRGLTVKSGPCELAGPGHDDDVADAVNTAQRTGRGVVLLD